MQFRRSCSRPTTFSKMLLFYFFESKFCLPVSPYTCVRCASQFSLYCAANTLPKIRTQAYATSTPLLECNVGSSRVVFFSAAIFYIRIQNIQQDFLAVYRSFFHYHIFCPRKSSILFILERESQTVCSIYFIKLVIFCYFRENQKNI